MNEAKKTVGILQPGYLPWLGFFDQIQASDVFVIYDDVQFDKHGWRNRNRIKSSDGAQWLTVPVLHKGLGRQLIKDVRINYTDNWIEKHIRTITQNYSKSSFFSEYASKIFECLHEKHEHLANLNIKLIRILCSFLGIETPIIRSSDIPLEGDKIERLISCIRYCGGTNFIEGSAGKSYIDVDHFRRCGIEIRYQNYNHPEYFQLYEDFVSHLSIVDLLFNCGTESSLILKNG